MTDLERTLQTLVDDPSAPPTDLTTIERRAGRLRRRRQVAAGAGALVLVAALGLATSSLLAGQTTPAPIVGGPTGVDDPVTEVPATDAPDALPPGDATEPAPTGGAAAPPVDATEPATEPPGGGNPETDPPLWVTDDERVAWQAENGRDGYWVAAYFLPADYAERDDAYELTTADLEKRWRLIGPEADDDTQALIRAAFEALAGAEPQDGLVNALGGGAALDIVSASDPFADGRATIVFTDELIDSTRTGTAGAISIMQQMTAMFAHYYPAATEGCIATESTRDDPESTVAFHDMEVCPFAIER